MNNTIKSFLKQVDTYGSENSYFIRRLIYYPNDIFNKKLQKENKEIYLKNIKPYLLNNTVLYFLSIALRIHDFADKLDYDTVSLMLEEIKSCDDFYYTMKDGFGKDILNDDVQDYFHRRKKLNIILTTKYGWSTLNYMAEYYKKHSFLYDNISDFYSIDDYDMNYSERVITELESLKKSKYEKEVIPKKEEIVIIKRILTDDYNDEESCIINNYSCTQRKMVSTVICNNKFLDAVNTILDYDLSVNTLKNILEYLNLSLEIKFDTFDDYLFRDKCVSLIREEKLEEFDDIYAAELINEIKEILREKRTLNKVVMFRNNYS